MLYRIVRRYRDNQRREVIKTDLSEANAQQYCRWAESSSPTATSASARARTATFGPWFDGYEEQAPKRRPKADSLTRALVGIYQID